MNVARWTFSQPVAVSTEIDSAFELYVGSYGWLGPSGVAVQVGGPNTVDFEYDYEVGGALARLRVTPTFVVPAAGVWSLPWSGVVDY